MGSPLARATNQTKAHDMNTRRLLGTNQIVGAACLTLLLAASAQSQEIDLLLKGGHVLDPRNRIDAVMDVAIAKGTIVQVAPDISALRAKTVVDVGGMYVTPGLIDMHVHAYQGNEPDAYIANGFTSLPPDAFTFRAGVTTVVDAGSSGWRNFVNFKKQTIDQSQTRVLALLNIVGGGMASRFEEQNTHDMDPVQTAYMINRLFPKIIVGIKAAHYWGDFTQVIRAVGDKVYKAGVLAFLQALE